MKCLLCELELELGDTVEQITNGPAHAECLLRGVIGGIGHLVDHQRFCIREQDPDAGLSYRESSLLVWQIVRHDAHLTADALVRFREISH